MIKPSTTVGTEIEFYRLGTHATDSLNGWLRFHVYNDGSVRDTTYLAGTLPVFPQEDVNGDPILSTGMRGQSPYGLEVITDPYTFEEFTPLSQKLAYFFSTTPQSPRTSIHVHVDADKETWRELQMLMRWAHALEAIIYRVACGGGQHRGERSHRGELNDHKFARPLSSPIGVNWTTGRGPLIQLDRLLNATTASEFVCAWGRLDAYWGMGLEHYMPHRLHMINLASILRTGTIEWRVFDGLYAYFDVIVDFVYHIHALAGKMQSPDFVFELGSVPNVDADWVSKLLDMDITPLWGENWQKSCVHRAPLSHYSSQSPLTMVKTPAIIHNGRKMDDGTDLFQPYIRGAR